jgi:hypothetical protein
MSIRKAVVHSSTLSMALVVGSLGLSATRAEAQPRSEPRVRVWMNANFQITTTNFDHTAALPVYQETGDIASTYTSPTGLAPDVGGGFRITRRAWVGASVSQFEHDGSASVTAHIPNPILFNQPRLVEGTSGDVGRSERAIHVHAGWMVPLTRRMELSVFVGPTFFTVRQDLILNVSYGETYPFDSAAFAGLMLERRKTSTVGFNAGADLTVKLSRHFGVGALVRVARADASFSSPLGGDVTSTAGGVQAGGGVRMRF